MALLRLSSETFKPPQRSKRKKFLPLNWLRLYLLKNLGIKSKGYIAYNFHVFSQSRVFRQTESSDINFPLPTIGKRST
jgi:hypothetical protein